MSTDLTCVSPAHSVRHAVQLMLEKDISSLPVLDDEGRLVGILTEGDLLSRAELGTAAPLVGQSGDSEAAALRYAKHQGWNVEAVMTTNIVTAEENTPVDRIASLMKMHGIKRIPIMRGKRLVGVVSRRDLLRPFLLTPPDATASGDAAIRRSILSRLHNELGFQAGSVDVAVSEGLVRLSLHLGSDAERRALRSVVENVRGVVGVEIEDSAIARPSSGATDEIGKAE